MGDMDAIINNIENDNKISTACKRGDWETFQDLVNNGASIETIERHTNLLQKVEI